MERQSIPRLCRCGCGKPVAHGYKFTTECSIRRRTNYYFDRHPRLCRCGCGLPAPVWKQFIHEHWLAREEVRHKRKNQEKREKLQSILLEKARASEDPAVWDKLLTEFGLGIYRGMTAGGKTIAYGHDYKSQRPNPWPLGDDG